MRISDWSSDVCSSDLRMMPQNLTADNQATDTLPAVSPDGQWLAYGAMARPGYESDRMVLMLRNLENGETRKLTEAWDRSVGSIAWAPDGKSLYVTAQEAQIVREPCRERGVQYV